jgi:hypothetical protein
MDIEAATVMLRKVAIDQLVGHHVRSDRLIQFGLDALLAGVESPSLPLLAGLTRAEEPNAQKVFGRVVAELGLIPDDLPPLPVPRAWASARWWAQLIAKGEMDVRTGGDLIYWYGWAAIPYEQSEPLQPSISSIVQGQDTAETWAVWDTGYRSRVLDADAKVVDEARTFIQG